MPISETKYFIISTIKLGISLTFPPEIGLQIVESVPQVAVGVEAGATVLSANEEIGIIKIAAAKRMLAAVESANLKYFFVFKFMPI